MFLRVFFFCLALAAHVALPAQAYEFAPIVADFEAQGPGAARSFVVKNTQTEAVALQIEVFRRTADENGKEVRTPDYDSFIVTPPQLVLAPGASQAVRAQWIGSPDLEEELSFRFVVTQLPIRYKEDIKGGDIKTDFTLGYKYEAAIYVGPRKPVTSAQLISSEPATSSDGKPVLRLTIRNTGTRRAILEQPTLKVSSASGGASVDLGGERVSGLQMKNIICGTQMVVDLPWPPEIPVGPVKVELNTRYFRS